MNIYSQECSTHRGQRRALSLLELQLLVFVLRTRFSSSEGALMLSHPSARAHHFKHSYDEDIWYDSLHKVLRKMCISGCIHAQFSTNGDRALSFFSKRKLGVFSSSTVSQCIKGKTPLILRCSAFHCEQTKKNE